MKGDWRSRGWKLGGASALATALVGGAAWAVPTINPTSGPAGTRVTVTDPDCPPPRGSFLSLVTGFQVFDSTGALIESGTSPAGGAVAISGPGSGVVSGPPGTYFIGVRCQSSIFEVSASPRQRLTFVVTGDDPAGEPAAPAPAAHPGVEPVQGSRAAERAAEVAARNQARQAEIAARQAERAAEVAARNQARQVEIAARQAERTAEVAARNQARQAEIAARQAERAAEVAVRAAERAAR